MATVGEREFINGCVFLCGLSALRYDFIRFFEGKKKLKEGLSAKSAWLPPTRGLRSWRSQMSADDVAVFDGIAGKWLDHTGYEHGNYRGSQAVKGSCLAWWETEEKSKG